MRLVPMLGIVVLLVAGCSHQPPERTTPKMSGGTGAISGKLVGADGEPFDLSLAGGAEKLRIELTSPAKGLVAAVHPFRKRPAFIVDDVPPGTYELAVYRAVPGESTIAGNQQVTVDAGQVAPVTLTLQVVKDKAAGR